MSDPLREVRPGDPLEIPAEAYNAFVAAARAHRIRGSLFQSEPLGSIGPQNVLVRVKNTTGQLCPRFGVMAVSGNVFDPTAASQYQRTNDQIALLGHVAGTKPTSPWVVAQEPIPDGQIGLAMAAGVTLVYMPPPPLSTDPRFMADVVPSASGFSLALRRVGRAAVVWRPAPIQASIAVIAFPAKPAFTRCWGQLKQTLYCNNPNMPFAEMDVIINGCVVDTIRVRSNPVRTFGVILQGMKVEAEYDPQLDEFVVVSGGKAKRIEVLITNNFDTTDTLVPSQYLYGCDGEDPVPLNSSIEVLNTGNIFSGHTGAHGLAYYDPDADVYKLYQISC